MAWRERIAVWFFAPLVIVVLVALALDMPGALTFGQGWLGKAIRFVIQDIALLFAFVVLGILIVALLPERYGEKVFLAMLPQIRNAWFIALTIILSPFVLLFITLLRGAFAGVGR